MLLEEYGLIGDLESAALVGRNGAIDWLCLPRFDSASCFSALLGDEQHGRWLLAPAGKVRATTRRYRPKTLVLENEFETADGAVRVIDFMPRRVLALSLLAPAVVAADKLIRIRRQRSAVPEMDLREPAAATSAGDRASRVMADGGRGREPRPG
jgi:GH15 family glucan-1,4-alpha-glucosidase